jgi:SAM-dependent methyltransferase
VLPRQPVVLNYRFPDARAASRVPRRDVSLVQCARCHLVFNATFDPAVIPYDDAYENRQCFSDAFTRHLTGLAKRLTRDLPASGGRILEVGCGKGDFLRLLCQVSGATAEGYDTSYEGAEQEPGIRFHPDRQVRPRFLVGFPTVKQRFGTEQVLEGLTGERLFPVALLLVQSAATLVRGFVADGLLRLEVRVDVRCHDFGTFGHSLSPF